MSAVIRLTASTRGTNGVEIDEIKAAIKSLTTDERRRIALYILELEKEHVQKSFVPPIVHDLENVLKVLQEAIDRFKRPGK